MRDSTRRYRYYVSWALHHGTTTTDAGVRIPAREIEGLVAEQVAALFDDPVGLIGKARLAVTPQLMTNLDERARTAHSAIRAPRPAHLGELVAQVRVATGRVEIDVDVSRMAALLKAEPASNVPATLTLTADVRLTRTGRVVRLVHQVGRP